MHDKALLEAVEKGDRQKVLELLSRGASVNAKGINDTALETAIFQQDVEMVQLLLEKGAKIEAEDLGEAAAAAQGDKIKATRIVRLLLEKGARIGDCAQDDTLMNDDGTVARGSRCTQTAGENALRKAAGKNNLEVVRLCSPRRFGKYDRFDNRYSRRQQDRCDRCCEVTADAARMSGAYQRGETVLMLAARRFNGRHSVVFAR